MPMIKQVVDINEDEDNVYFRFLNVSGAGASAGSPLFVDFETVTDGVACTQYSGAQTGTLFKGVCQAYCQSSSYGVGLSYGVSNITLSQASAGVTPRAYLTAVGTIFDNAATFSAALASAWDKVVLIETVAASVGFSSAAQLATFKAFITAM